MKNTNVLLVGVGGQGTVLASTILTKGLIQAGYDVKMSEIHGMSQRGGSVMTQVRFGDDVKSAVVGKGEADIIVSFEQMEALRYLEMLRKGGEIITSKEKLASAPISASLAEYPDGILDEVSKHAKVYSLEADVIAEELGNKKVANVVLFGALAKLLNLEEIDWIEIIKSTVKEKFIDINIEAFKRGNAAVGASE